MRTLLLFASLLALPACIGSKDTDADDEGPGGGGGGGEDEDSDGYTSSEGDCDDANAEVNPGSTEICDGVDNDCDDTIDEDGTTLFYADGDGDGFGDNDTTQTACEPPSGYSAVGDDCDDQDRRVYPGADEICDGADNDCNGEVDEDGDTTWYRDGDDDGFGDNAATQTSCDQPEGYAAEGDDCDDRDETIYPGAREVCDGEDNDCDGGVDEDGEATWYRDADSDGYGDDDSTQVSCEQPAGYAAAGGDCDDREAAANPGEAEVCDAIDNDCDGSVDEGTTSTWYEDGDGDGYGDPRTGTDACDAPAAGWVNNADDCDDTEALAYNGAAEVCDDVDNDCDGDVDNDAVDASDYPVDDDGDGFGHATDTELACDGPTNTMDCDDGNANEPQVVDGSHTGSSDGSITNPWTSIQDGIDNSTMCVAVYPGTYTENIDFDGNDVEVFSTDGATSTTIEATSGSVVTFQSNETAAAELRGFTIAGGTGTLESSSSSESCGSGSTCTTTYDRYYGGGVLVDGAEPTLRYLTITGNELPEYEYTEVSTTLTEYVYSYGGGIFVNDSTGMTAEGLEISRNFADAGGGLYAGDSAAFELSQSRVLYNTASTGGGVASSGATVDFTNVLVVGNTASTEGGGFWMEDGTSTWWNVTAVGNACETGAAVAVLGSGSLDLYSSIVAWNLVGYGLYFESGATLDAQYSDAYGNTMGEYDGVTDPTGSNGNIDADPDFTSWTDNGVDDDAFTLLTGSACIDAGNPSATYYDADGTRNDQGAYGGPGGSW